MEGTILDYSHKCQNAGSDEYTTHPLNIEVQDWARTVLGWKPAWELLAQLVLVWILALIRGECIESGPQCWWQNIMLESVLGISGRCNLYQWVLKW